MEKINLCSKNETTFSNLKLEVEPAKNWSFFKTTSKIARTLKKLDQDKLFSYEFFYWPDKLLLHFTCFETCLTESEEFGWYLHNYVHHHYGLVSSDYNKLPEEECTEIVKSDKMEDIQSRILNDINEPYSSGFGELADWDEYKKQAIEHSPELVKYAIHHGLTFKVDSSKILSPKFNKK